METFDNPLGRRHAEEVDRKSIRSYIPITCDKWAIISLVALLFSIVAFAMSLALFVKIHQIEWEQLQATNEPMKLQSNQNDISHLMDSIQKINISLSKMNEFMDKVDICSVGVKSGKLPNAAMSASSYYGKPYLPRYGRLDRPGSTYAFWHSKDRKAGEWLQVHLGNATKVTGVVTQGRSDNIEDWVTSYKISYGNSTDNMTAIKGLDGEDLIFPGNRDMHTHVTNMFSPPITARFFRLIVQTWTRSIALRLEYLTC